MVKPWLDDMRKREQASFDKVRPELESDSVPINPLRACKEIADSVGEDAIFIGDGGDFVATAASVVRVYQQGHWLDPGPLGTLGVGPGYAMAAKLAKPSSPVVIIYGDGSFGLHAMEFEACVRQKINVVGVIGNDAGWTQIRRGQVQLYGERALGGDGARRSPATTRWSKRSAATASTSSGRRTSGPRWSGRWRPASRRW